MPSELLVSPSELDKRLLPDILVDKATGVGACELTQKVGLKGARWPSAVDR